MFMFMVQHDKVSAKKKKKTVGRNKRTVGELSHYPGSVGSGTLNRFKPFWLMYVPFKRKVDPALTIDVSASEAQQSALEAQQSFRLGLFSSVRGHGYERRNDRSDTILKTKGSTT